jgi:hypothetical protein
MADQRFGLLRRVAGYDPFSLADQTGRPVHARGDVRRGAADGLLCVAGRARAARL